MLRIIKKKLILVLLILLLILILLIGIVMNLSKKTEEMNTPAMSAEKLDQFFKENKILTYKNLTKISFIEGLTSTEVIARIEEIVTKYIPELYNITEDFKEDELRNYYKKNEKTINKKLSISSEDEFLELINDLKSLQTEIDSYDYCEYLEDESEINIENKSYRLTFNVYFRNNKFFKFHLNINK